MSTFDGFLPLTRPAWNPIPRGDPSLPVLWRWVYVPRKPPTPRGTNIAEQYPARVLYGGPTTVGAIESPQGQAIASAIMAMFWSAGWEAVNHFVPIARPGQGHDWPHAGFRWWYVTEPRRRDLYGLVVWPWTEPPHYEVRA